MNTERMLLCVDGEFYTLQCKTHLAYRAKRAPAPGRDCPTCKTMWALRRAARRLVEERKGL